MTAARRISETWRQPGCGDTCRVDRAIKPGVLGWFTFETHDPDAHAAWGRRMAEAEHVAPVPVLHTGPLVIDRDRYEVTVDGRIVFLSATEMRILMSLARRTGVLVPYRELIARVWGEMYQVGPISSTLGGLRTVLVRLRQQLGRAGALVTTVPGVGLRLELIAPGADPPAQPQCLRWPASSPRQWSLNHPRCVCCGSTAQRHKARGRCSRCAPTVGRLRSHHGPCQTPPAEDGAREGADHD